ncbi:hypothetical protein BH09BAC1_BH09BAC1_21630 [soil metagenome]
MDFNYKPLLRLSLQHNYYSSGALSRVGIKASPATESVLKNYGLAWKHSKGQLAVLQDVEDAGSEEKLKGLLNDDVKLQFWIYMEDAAFLNYTNLPFTQNQDQIYYFSNAITPSRLNAGQLTLSRDEYVGAADVVMLYQGSSIFLLRENKKDNKTDINDIFNQAIGQVNERPDSFEVTGFDEDGGYYVWKDGKAEYPFFVDRHFGWQKPFAVVEFFFNTKVRENARPINNDLTVTPLNFVLGFNRRSVFWKYYIMSGHLRELDGLAIANGKSGPVFIGPEKEQVLGKHESETFISDRVLDFTESRTYKFQLHKNFDPQKANDKPGIKALPNPEPDQLKPMAGKPGQYYTEIFIY